MKDPVDEPDWAQERASMIVYATVGAGSLTLASKIAAELREAYERGLHNAGARPALPTTLRLFAEAWRPLPPLIRASAGVNVLGRLDDLQLRWERSYLDNRLRAARRARVADQVCLATETLSALVLNLVNEADNEAMDMGIDADGADVDGEPQSASVRRALRRLNEP